MSASNGTARISLGEFLAKIEKELVPASNRFLYFSASSPMSEEDLRDYVEDPVSGLPPAVADLLPKVILLLVPFIERANGKERREWEDFVAFERPAEGKALRSVQWSLGQAEDAVIALATDEMEVADAHYELYHQLAWRVGAIVTDEFLSDFFALIREELSNRMHGEVDEQSWQLKQALLRRASKVKKDSKAFREYARASFIDTLTLYLHGICCDIDVETGPRQLPSRYLRRRLKWLHGVFPPPKGYVVFPEDLDSPEPSR